jgi:hypothetical protein
MDRSPSIVPDLPGDRGAALFREMPMERLERWVLGLAWPLRPGRIGGLPALARLWIAAWEPGASGAPQSRAAAPVEAMGF